MKKLFKTLAVAAVAAACICSCVAFSACGEEEHTHTWDSGEVTKAATCTEAGTMTYTCTECSETKTETIAATGHTWGAYAETTAATCTEKGTETRTCTVCGATESQDIAALGHTWDEGVEQEDGSILYTCTVCGETTTDTSSSSGNTEDSGNADETGTYTFEGEYVTFDESTWKAGGVSGTPASYLDTIVQNSNASNGYYVGYMHKTGANLQFVIDASEDCEVTMALSLGNEMSQITINPSVYSIIVNGEAFQYDDITLPGHVSGAYTFSTYTVSPTISLKAGTNSIIFMVLENTFMNGASGAPLFDCMYLTPSNGATLTFTNYYNNLEDL